MKTLIRFIIFMFLVSVAIVSCSNKEKMYEMDSVIALSEISESEVMDYKEYAPVSMDENMNMSEQQRTVQFTPPVIQNYIATSGATTINDDENHKFIRTATLRFKVKDVVSGTSIIEDIILKNKGFIIRSAITNNQSEVGRYNVSDDSLLVITNNYLEGDLNLKVPRELLDLTLREIAPIAVHIDYRVVEAEDVTVKLLSDKLEQERMAKKQKRIGNAIGSRSGKLGDAMNAEDRLDDALRQADNAYLSAFTMNEKIAYSTIKINIYQDPVTEKSMTFLPNYDNYKPGFGAKMIDGLSGGWNIICAIFLFFVNIWPITLLILGIVGFIYWRYGKKSKMKE